jgi:hypothetical protein
MRRGRTPSSKGESFIPHEDMRSSADERIATKGPVKGATQPPSAQRQRRRLTGVSWIERPRFLPSIVAKA